MSHCIPATVCIKPKLNYVPRYLSLQGKEGSNFTFQFVDPLFPHKVHLVSWKEAEVVDG